MGRYSRKDMIEFAKFAKSWQTPRSVEKAYEHYIKGKRLTSPNQSDTGYREGRRKGGVRTGDYGRNDMLSDQNLMGKIK